LLKVVDDALQAAQFGVVRRRCGRPCLKLGDDAVQPVQFVLDLIEKRIYLVLVVAAFAERRLGERRVLNVSGREWHRYLVELAM
jgi:hypothetical protein